MFDAVAPSFNLNQLRMMGEPVDDGGGDGVIMEDLPPIFEGPVRCKNHGALLIAGGNHLEEQVGTPLVKRKVPHFIDD